MVGVVLSQRLKVKRKNYQVTSKTMNLEQPNKHTPGGIAESLGNDRKLEWQDDPKVAELAARTIEERMGDAVEREREGREILTSLSLPEKERQILDSYLEHPNFGAMKEFWNLDENTFKKLLEGRSLFERGILGRQEAESIAGVVENKLRHIQAIEQTMGNATPEKISLRWYIFNKHVEAYAEKVKQQIGLD